MSNRTVEAFNVHPIFNAEGTIPAVAVKLKLRNGSLETILIGPYVGRVLNIVFSHLEQNKWTQLALLPPDASRQ